MEAFALAPSVGAAVIAAPPGHEAAVESAARTAAAAAGEGAELRIEVLTGGATRAESVALALAPAESELVAVHDAARPLLEVELIEALVGRLSSRSDAAGVIAAAALTDTVKRAGDDGVIVATEDRDRLWAAQTPQLFRTAALREAHAARPGGAAPATDDAMLVEQAGGRVLIEPAPAENLKVTTPVDLRLAELLLGARGRSR